MEFGEWVEVEMIQGDRLLVMVEAGWCVRILYCLLCIRLKISVIQNFFLKRYLRDNNNQWHFRLSILSNCLDI